MKIIESSLICLPSTDLPFCSLPPPSPQVSNQKMHPNILLLKKLDERDVWLAQSEEHVTPNLGVLSLSPMLGKEIT